MKKSMVFGVMLALCAVIGLAACGAESEKETESGVPIESLEEKGTDYLVLVNKENLISGDYVNTIQLCDIDNVDGGTYQVEKQTKEAFEELAEALKEKGVEIGVDSAYRSVEQQQEIMDQFIADYGEDYARRTVAQPGTSEHHTGLVIDLVPKVNGQWVIENEDMLKETEIFKVIHATLPKYGFILRYPKGKEDITGYDYEPWHIRYVGKEAAQEIYDQQITLEEYLGE
ncbi:MAG: M15 family metallopeptidase [Lachnospiraceae bacterium]|nr:M15 family metallopeptidase [Lachnospiraceae bacterium]